MGQTGSQGLGCEAVKGPGPWGGVYLASLPWDLRSLGDLVIWHLADPKMGQD